LSAHPQLKPGECVFVGDTYDVDIIGALGAGMLPVWINNDDSPVNPHHVTRIGDIPDLLELLHL